MQDLVEFIVKALVDEPEAVEVITEDSQEEIKVKIRVAPGDMGKVIGKQGRIAKAIRTVAKAKGARDGKKSFIEIVE